MSGQAFTHTNKDGVKYYLHSKEVQLRGAQKRTIYFFAREVRDGSLIEIPEGMEVIENERTGLPMLRKSGRS